MHSVSLRGVSDERRDPAAHSPPSAARDARPPAAGGSVRVERASAPATGGQGRPLHPAPGGQGSPAHPTPGGQGRPAHPQVTPYAPADPQAGAVLIVEDDPENRAVLAETVAAAGYHFDAVDRGEAALDALRSGWFDAVLLDISMPGIDGFEVLRRIRAEHGPGALPIIMISGLSERQHVVQALRLGANDYVLKPFDAAIVTARLGAQVALKRAFDQVLRADRALHHRNRLLQRDHDALQAAYGSIKTDLAYAARIQQALLPTELPGLPGVRLAWCCHPCSELAGDSLNVFQLDPRHVALYLVDVSGHGVSAALLSVAISRALQPVPGRPSLVQRRAPGSGRLSPAPPAVVAEELNRRFQLQPETYQYLTMIYGVLDLRTRELRFVCAGHPGPVRVQASGPPQYVEHHGIAIGLVPDPEYREGVLRLSPGERLYLHSDGLSEARNAANEQFGAARILEAVEQGRRAALDPSLRDLVEAARTWAGRPFEDDVSAIALECC